MNLYLQTKPKNWFSRASIGYVTSDLAFNTGPQLDLDHNRSGGPVTVSTYPPTGLKSLEIFRTDLDHDQFLCKNRIARAEMDHNPQM